MYKNLKRALKEKKISTKDLAEFLEVTEKTAANKLNGITDFTYTEFSKICKFLFPEYNAEWLFAYCEAS